MTTETPVMAEVELSYRSKVKASDRPKITSSQITYGLLKTIYNPGKVEHVESFYALFLNRANNVLGWILLSSGGTCGTVVDPKTLFQAALKTNAHGIILSHNHPSGNLIPSEQDDAVTRKIKDGARILDMKLLDHIIYTEEGYYSYSEEDKL
jgi:DNA repair protein RadC